MFLQLNHQRLEVFKLSQKFVLECYKLTKIFPADEKFAMVQQIRRAALSVHLNVAEGCSRKSLAERKRFFEISRGSIIEIDAAPDIASALGYCYQEKLMDLGHYMLDCFKMLSSLIQKDTAPYIHIHY
ncbi:MAG: four helix bundle protein [Flavisolibacter sp.]|nr:four helix bundle protein [Flavisolibacter sp.]